MRVLISCQKSSGNGAALSSFISNARKLKPKLLAGRPDSQNFRILIVCLLWAFFENYRSRLKFRLFLFTVKVANNFFTKMAWNKFWADFFTHPSGHPGFPATLEKWPKLFSTASDDEASA
jgi:hypothetical protein